MSQTEVMENFNAKAHKKGLSNSVKVDGHTQRVIFFDPTRIEKRLREFVVDYVPNAVTEVTGVTVSTRNIPNSPLFNCSQKTSEPHTKSVTSVTSVTNLQIPDPEYPPFDYGSQEEEDS